LYGKALRRRQTLEWRELLGFMGGALTTVGFIPQVWRLFRLRSAHEISLPFTAFFVTGIGFWLSYGISMGLPSVIIWNGITFAMGWAMLYAKLRYGR
jgi:MtN3 and saliva related transmembrane protein